MSELLLEYVLKAEEVNKDYYVYIDTNTVDN